MERAIDAYYQRNNISRVPLEQKVGGVGLGLEAMQLAVPKENERILKIEEELNHRIVGQPDAVHSIVTALSRGEFRNPNRPIANMLFLGQTGVGKTETARELASILNDGDIEGTFLRIDCSQYANGNEVSHLQGASPNYVGYDQKAKFEEIDSTRQNVVLFDEIEKAHPKLHDLMLQILDNGELAMMNSEEVVSFRNSIIIATSNIGSGEISKLVEGRTLGFNDSSVPKEVVSKKRVRQAALDSLKDHFRPEFIGRFNHKVSFDSFNDEQFGAVLDRYVEKLNESEQYQNLGVELTIASELRDKIVAETEDRHLFGARPVLDYFDATVGKEFGDHVSTGSILWQSSAHAVPADSVSPEEVGFDLSSRTAVFYFDSPATVHERKLQELNKDLHFALEAMERSSMSESRAKRRSKKRK